MGAVSRSRENGFRDLAVVRFWFEKLFQSCQLQEGFTLVEMLMTLVILSVLSATALPKFFDLSAYQQRTFFDDTLNAIRYAQKLAVATSCNVQVSISANQYQLKRPSAADRSLCTSFDTADFTQNVKRPGSGDMTYQGSQAGIAITSSVFYFTAKGAASANATISVGSGQISVEQETGLVYDSSS